MKREALITILLLVIFALIPVYASVFDHSYAMTLAARMLILGMAAMGLNIALGLGGMVSFGHAAFFGIGGYVMGVLAFHAQNYTPLISWPFPLGGTSQMIVIWIVTLLVSGLAAFVIGLLVLPTSGVYFIMATLAFAQMIYYFAISWPAYGGEDGLPIYVRNKFPGLNTMDVSQFYWLVFGLFCVVVVIMWRFFHSRFALALNGLRQNNDRIEAVGISPKQIKLTAYVISAMITALAGALFADLNRFVSPSMMGWNISGELIVFIIIGGVGRLMGPLLGAVVFVLAEFFLGGLSEYWQFYFGVILLFVVLMAKNGIMGILAPKV